MLFNNKHPATQDNGTVTIPFCLYTELLVTMNLFPEKKYFLAPLVQRPGINYLWKELTYVSISIPDSVGSVSRVYTAPTLQGYAEMAPNSSTVIIRTCPTLRMSSLPVSHPVLSDFLPIPHTFFPFFPTY